MVRITLDDFKKAVEFLNKECNGMVLAFKIDGVNLIIETVDRQGLGVMIQLSDAEYPHKPRVTKTDTL